jgi:predicted RNA-binding Zn ribbon-like protein
VAIAYESMVAGTWSRLKVCPADDCQWAFYDHSRNHSRTWCEMEECGNRAKARAWRERQRASR